MKNKKNQFNNDDKFEDINSNDEKESILGELLRYELKRRILKEKNQKESPKIQERKKKRLERWKKVKLSLVNVRSHIGKRVRKLTEPELLVSLFVASTIYFQASFQKKYYQE